MRALRILALASVSLSGVAAPAFAQDTVAGDANGIGAANNDIIVSARRKEERLQDVPLTVQALTTESLQKLNIRDFKDIQTLVPGLTMAQDANGIGSRTTIRGINFDVNASGNDGTVEFYFNDSSISSIILFQSMYDIERVEVLRGPQGTLRGRASPSGSITVTSRRPDLNQFGGYVSGTATSIGGWNLQGAINVPIISDKLAVRVAGIMDENEINLIRSINNSLEPLQKNRGIRASIRAEPFDFLSLGFNYSWSNRKVIDFAQVESANIADPTQPASPVFITPGDRRGVMGSPQRYDQTSEVYNWQAELRQFGQKLNYVGSISKQHSRSVYPVDRGGFFAFSAFPNPFVPGSDDRDLINGAGTETLNFGNMENHEIRLSSDERIGGIFDYVVGYFSTKSNAEYVLNVDQTIFVQPFAGTVADPTNPAPNFLAAFVTLPIRGPSNYHERSFFGNVTAHIGDTLEISGGVRRIKYHGESRFISPAGPVPDVNRDQQGTIWSASAKYTVSSDLMVYANFGTSWRPGSGLNPVLISAGGAIPSQFIIDRFYTPAAEKSKSYEIGFKSEWLDDRLRINVSAYHQTFENFAYLSPRVFFGTSNSQGDRVYQSNPGIVATVPAKVDGIEAEISFKATPNWSMDLIASYAVSKIKNGNVPCNDFYRNSDNTPGISDGIPDTSSTPPTFAQIDAATGGALVAFCNINTRAGLSAPFSLTAQSEYSHPLTDKFDAYIRGLVNYNGHSQNEPLNAVDDIKPYATVNLFVGARASNGSWDVGLYVKNLFDTERVLTRQSFVAQTTYNTAPFVPASANTTYREITLNAPREFGITARATFGSR